MSIAFFSDHARSHIQDTRGLRKQNLMEWMVLNSEQPHPCSVYGPCNSISHIQDLLSTFSRPHPWNWNLDCKRWETTDSNLPGPMKLSSQSTAGVRLSCAFCQPQYPVLNCWAKTILLIQTSTFWLFFIQNILYSALVEFLLELWAISCLTYFHQDFWNQVEKSWLEAWTPS